MDTVEGVYRSIEEIFRSYNERKMKALLAHSKVAQTEESLHQLLGRAQAGDELLRIVRSTLGYDYSNL